MSQLHSIAICGLAAALTGCAVDDRQVSRIELGADAGSPVNSALERPSPAPSPSNPDSSPPPATGATDSVCEAPGCGGSPPLSQPGPQAATDEQMAGANQNEEPMVDATPAPCPPNNVCQQFSADDCTPSFTPAARGGEACQCDGQDCRLLAGEACGQAVDCRSGNCRATQTGALVCCEALCGTEDLCSDEGTACLARKAPVGQQCLENSDCETNFCTDGVCCNEACDGVCETCSETGSCRAAFDDNACPIVRCGSTDPGCSENNEDLFANRCQARGVCKGLDACGLAPAGLACATGFCSGAGECQRPTVNCGSPCDTTGVGAGVFCCSLADSFEFQCTDERDCISPPNRPVVCDEHSDCVEGSVCCLTTSPFNSEVLCVPEAQCAPQLGVRASFNQICSAPGASTSPCPEGQACTANPPGNHLPDWFTCQ